MSPNVYNVVSSASDADSRHMLSLFFTSTTLLPRVSLPSLTCFFFLFSSNYLITSSPAKSYRYFCYIMLFCAFFSATPYKYSPFTMLVSMLIDLLLLLCLVAMLYNCPKQYAMCDASAIFFCFIFCFFFTYCFSLLIKNDDEIIHGANRLFFSTRVLLFSFS